MEYGEKLSLREIQMAEYDILCKLVRYFDIRQINYILCGGTMLGAVRHNGFIPWDDDIDILVPREDYEKLKEMYCTGDTNIEGVILNIPGEKNSPYPFIKAINPSLIVVEEVRDEEFRANVWIDIFPMDHFPDNDKMHRLYLTRITSLIKILSSCTISDDYLKRKGYYTNPIKRVKLMISRILYKYLGGNVNISKKIDEIAYMMNKKFQNSNHVGNGAWPNGMNDYFSVSDVKPVIKHKFEDSEFNIPLNYDSFLTHFYGDYMQIPSVEERQNHHITVYRLEKRK